MSCVHVAGDAVGVGPLVAVKRSGAVDPLEQHVAIAVQPDGEVATAALVGELAHAVDVRPRSPGSSARRRW